MDYPIETFTEDERALLAPHFTNLERPVFALVNLPETVKGALFARYSRYQGTLRRLYLEEFAENAEPGPSFDGAEGERARRLYERIFIGYGDDSVAQLGGAHIACEWVSNVMTKLLQRGRLAAYLEQSTRYMPYDAPMGAGLGYRYWRHAELGPEYDAAMDFMFEAYSEALPRVEAWAAERFPRAEDEPEAAHARSIRAKALDLLRGLLPASSLSHVGIFASGQAYEQLLLRLFASPLPEARDYASMMLEELKAVVPSFVARVERPDRGGEWISYLEEREQAGERWAARLGLDRARRDQETGPAVRLLSVQGSEEDLLAALLFEAAAVSEDESRSALRNLPPDERATMLAELVGERRNRRHRPGRGFEALRYRFEVVSDYGAFRDLQRHRLLTVQWQTLGPELDPLRAGHERPRGHASRRAALRA
jgi:thymidylate synthase ThyX